MVPRESHINVKDVPDWESFDQVLMEVKASKDQIRSDVNLLQLSSLNRISLLTPSKPNLFVVKREDVCAPEDRIGIDVHLSRDSQSTKVHAIDRPKIVAVGAVIEILVAGGMSILADSHVLSFWQSGGGFLIFFALGQLVRLTLRHG